MRVYILERLIFGTFLVSASARVDTAGIEERRLALRELLEGNAQSVEKIFLQNLADPAHGALFADEAREVVQSLIAQVDRVSQQLTPRE